MHKKQDWNSNELSLADGWENAWTDADECFEQRQTDADECFEERQIDVLETYKYIHTIHGAEEL